MDYLDSNMPTYTSQLLRSKLKNNEMLDISYQSNPKFRGMARSIHFEELGNTGAIGASLSQSNHKSNHNVLINNYLNQSKNHLSSKELFYNPNSHQSGTGVFTTKKHSGENYNFPTNEYPFNFPQPLKQSLRNPIQVTDNSVKYSNVSNEFLNEFNKEIDTITGRIDHFENRHSLFKKNLYQGNSQKRLPVKLSQYNI